MAIFDLHDHRHSRGSLPTCRYCHLYSDHRSRNTYRSPNRRSDTIGYYIPDHNDNNYNKHNGRYTDRFGHYSSHCNGKEPRHDGMGYHQRSAIAGSSLGI